MAVFFDGFNEIIEKLEKMDNPEKVEQGVKRACALVERSAKQRAPKGEGELRRSITSEVSGLEGIVFTPLFYAPYVEYGTGCFAENNPKSGYWVYVRNSGGSSISSKRYSLEEAKQIVAMMRADGLDAVYTQGRHPSPFMRPALEKNRKKIVEIIERSLVND
jgi:HK97 gp10 family phage protein